MTKLNLFYQQNITSTWATSQTWTRLAGEQKAVHTKHGSVIQAMLVAKAMRAQQADSVSHLRLCVSNYQASQVLYYRPCSTRPMFNLYLPCQCIPPDTWCLSPCFTITRQWKRNHSYARPLLQAKAMQVPKLHGRGRLPIKPGDSNCMDGIQRRYGLE